VPRATDASFEPQIVLKRLRRLTGIYETVLSLTAKDLTTGEIASHFDDVYERLLMTLPLVENHDGTSGPNDVSGVDDSLPPQRCGVDCAAVASRASCRGRRV
jgi:hypothetical protein